MSFFLQFLVKLTYQVFRVIECGACMNSNIGIHKKQNRRDLFFPLLFLRFFYRASLYNLFQIKPTRCTLLLSIFISTSVHVSGNYVPIIRRTYCIYATLVFFTVYGWLSGLLQQTATHTQWKIQVSHRYSKFSWWWAHSCPKHVQKLK